MEELFLAGGRNRLARAPFFPLILLCSGGIPDGPMR